MKKIYLLAATALFALSANAQFMDDVESYPVGPLHAGNWSSWSGAAGGEDVIVTEAQANDGTKSIVVNTAGQDALLTTGGAATESGLWTMNFKMYVPTGKSAYFNIQGSDTPGDSFLSGDVYFNTANGAPGEAVDGDDTFNFPHDAWFDVQLIVDMDDTSYSIKIDGVTGVDGKAFNAAADKFASVDLFFAAPTDEYYIDSVNFMSGLLGADDFSADVFTVYPNPVVNTLNIRSAASVDNVTIYDVLGKQVLSVNPDAISPSVDMSNLSSGAYLVNVTIGNASKTIKVLK